jgi:circadian clock protein KaiB
MPMNVQLTGSVTVAGSKISDTWQFELYIAGDNRRSAIAVENLRDICCDYLQGQCHVEVFDLKMQPELTIIKQISAAPFLIKKSPLPERKLIGDLSNRARVLECLDLKLRGNKPGTEKDSRDYLQKEYFKLQHERLPR